MATTPDGLRRYIAAYDDVCERGGCGARIRPGDEAAWDVRDNERLCGSCADDVAEEREP